MIKIDNALLSKLILCFFFFTTEIYADDVVLIQSTTSIRDSGFYRYILDEYKKESSVVIKVIAVGTGQAIKNSKNCDADLLFVHHEPSERKFVDNGFGLYRKEVMYNDYVLIGPDKDPANIKFKKSIKVALQIIYNGKYPFVSRGDNSGTHMKERELWSLIKREVGSKKTKWYFESGSGMGSSLNLAVNIDGYIISDRSTWISFGNKKNHIVLVQNEPLLKNYYGIIPISPFNCPNVNVKEAEKFISWLTSKRGKRLINEFKVNNSQIFFTRD